MARGDISLQWHELSVFTKCCHRWHKVVAVVSGMSQVIVESAIRPH